MTVSQEGVFIVEATTSGNDSDGNWTSKTETHTSTDSEGLGTLIKELLE